MSEFFPPGWCDPSMRDKVVEFIRNLPISVDDKKQMIIAWVECAGLTLTAKMVEQATGRPAGEV